MIAVAPAPGVPPADVLALMFPDLDQEARETMSLETFLEMEEGLAQAVIDREENLAQAASKRKKREGS